MKENRLIIKAFGLFMSIFLLTAVLSKDFLKARSVANSTGQTEENDKEDSGDKQTFISEFSSEVVIPSHAFHFAGYLTFLLGPDVQILPFVKVVSSFAKPVFRHSYFDKLFEHHIAINAP